MCEEQTYVWLARIKNKKAEINQAAVLASADETLLGAMTSTRSVLVLPLVFSMDRSI